FIVKYLIIITLLAIGSFSYYLCTTPAGLQLELDYIARWLPGKLTIQTSSGSLFSGFTLQNISYQAAEEQIKIKSLTVHWVPIELLNRILFIDTLVVEEANVQINPSVKKSNAVSPVKFSKWSILS